MVGMRHQAIAIGWGHKLGPAHFFPLSDWDATLLDQDFPVLDAIKHDDPPPPRPHVLPEKELLDLFGGALLKQPMYLKVLADLLHNHRLTHCPIKALRLRSGWVSVDLSKASLCRLKVMSCVVVIVVHRPRSALYKCRRKSSAIRAALMAS